MATELEMGPLNNAAAPSQLRSNSRNKTQGEMRREGNCLSKIFKYLFCIYFILITVLVVVLIVRGVLSAEKNHDFNIKKWYIAVFTSTACAGIVGFTWQAVTSLNPSRTVRAAFWLSPLLTGAFGILQLLIGSRGGLALFVIALVSSVIQALYGCWASPRFVTANRIIAVSITYKPPKLRCTVVLSIIIGCLYSSFLMCGIGGATVTRARVDVLFILLILASLTWTMQIMKNFIQVTVSHFKYNIACGIEGEFKTVVKNAAKYSMGTICVGSILVPLADVIKGLARAVSMVSGDVDEFMFSCANCCTGIALRIVAYANRWGSVHVGVYNKGIVQASMDTWEMFSRLGMEDLINSDLTSSFCFLTGLATGSICGLVGGIWSLVIQKDYATEVSMYTFLIGYCLSRVAMAWIQASVVAYYVSYAENPDTQQFDTTIPDCIRQLQRSQA